MELQGRRSPDELDHDEQDVWLDYICEALNHPTAEEEAFFARRRAIGVGVGSSETGELIFAWDRKS